ncbi:MAG: FHA domain-containing protein [Thermodesulfobacteriota bacterium]
MEIGTQNLVYFIFPIVVIVLGIYFLFIHKRICPDCGRPVRPVWRECTCASEPSIFFSQEPEGEQEVGTPAETKPFSYDDAQPFSGEPMGTEVMLPSITSAWLLIEEQGMPERSYEIRGTAVSIGSSDDNDIVLTDKAVSRHHAKIRMEGKKHFIYDLASTNGTRVNGRKVTKKWIKEGDSIQVGHIKMTFKPSKTPKAKPSNLLKM